MPTNLRQSLVDHFNSSPSKQLLLISTRAGGLGLNLVSANRVVIFDPNWNPAQDLQAQDRSFRFGQKCHVVVFRLITAGSLEELVYSRQVFKQQLANIAVSGNMENRYLKVFRTAKNLKNNCLGFVICFVIFPISSLIIELHEKQGPQDNHPPSRKQELTELKNSSVPSEKGGSTLSSGSENDAKKTSRKPNLEDLGILYAYRNENIVNFGPGTQGKLENADPQNESPTYSMPVARKKKPEGRDGKENVSSSYSSMDRKRLQYSLLARSVGMGEVAFSKWVLSATPSEREKVLRNYNKRRTRYPMVDELVKHIL